MDWSNPVGSAISGGFGIIGSLVNYGLQKKLAAQQNQYNIEMWKLENEYNSPQAQMKRYEEAGLNPALMYGQVSSGNAPHAPEQVTPSAPDLSRDMQELGQAFNIEGLKTAIANRKKAQAEASNAQTEAQRNSLELFAETNFGQKYEFDPTTGTYKKRELPNDGSVTVIHPSAYYMNRILENNFRNNSLLVPRANLIGSQRLLNTQRTNLLAPQIRMSNYQSQYYPASFWIGNVKNGVQAITPFVTPFL